MTRSIIQSLCLPLFTSFHLFFSVYVFLFSLCFISLSFVLFLWPALSVSPWLKAKQYCFSTVFLYYSLALRYPWAKAKGSNYSLRSKRPTVCAYQKCIAGMSPYTWKGDGFPSSLVLESTFWLFFGWGRETPSWGNFGILAFAGHLHAQQSESV